MKTNFTNQRFLVLTTEDDKIIAIINCESGENDISEKLEQAIREEYDADEIVINAVLINGRETLNPVNEYDYNVKFKADIISPDYDTDTEKFTLTRTEIY
jgi:predicted nucleotide-binding protein